MDEIKDYKVSVLGIRNDIEFSKKHLFLLFLSVHINRTVVGWLVGWD